MLRLGASRDNGNAFLCQKPKKYLDRSFAIFFSASAISSIWLMEKEKMKLSNWELDNWKQRIKMLNKNQNMEEEWNIELQRFLIAKHRMRMRKEFVTYKLDSFS